MFQLSYDSSKMVIVDHGSIGVISNDSLNLVCLICNNPYCQHITELKKKKEEQNPSEELVDFLEKDDSAKPSRTITKSVSYTNNNFYPNCRTQFCLKKSPDIYLKKEDGILLCQDNVDNCSTCGAPLVVKENISSDLNLFTKSDIMKCRVFSKVCSNQTCNNVIAYDGGFDALFNMGRFVIHQEVLRDYMLHFLHGNSCTLSGYYEVWATTQQNSGNTEFRKIMNYSNWRNSWYCFLQNLDFDLKKSSECPKCGTIPDIIVCDATSLSYQKKYATVTLQQEIAPASVYPKFSNHQSRIAIPNKGVRDSLLQFVKGKHNQSLIKILMNDLKANHKPIYVSLRWVLQTYGSKIPKSILDMYYCIGSRSPVCSYLPPTDFILSLAEGLYEPNIKSNVETLRAIQTYLPIFFAVLNTLSIETCLPDEFKGLIIYLCDQAKEPYQNATPVLTTLPTSQDHMSSFPNMPLLRQRGAYEQDKISSKEDPCRKFYRGHPRLMPGIFTVYCTHGICFGYQVMESQESPNVPFTILKTRFPKAPKIVIYDNACSLHAYCLNCDPLYFKETMFMVDRFH